MSILKYNIQLSIPPYKPFIELIGSALDKVVIFYDFTIDELSDLYMAVKEAVNRAIVHNKLESNGKNQNLKIEFKIYADYLKIEIKILSKVSKLSNFPRIDTYDSIGFSFIKAIVDEFNFIYEDECKIFQIIKKA